MYSFMFMGGHFVAFASMIGGQCLLTINDEEGNYGITLKAPLPAEKIIRELLIRPDQTIDLFEVTL